LDRISYGPCSGTGCFGGNNWTELCKGRAQELAVLEARIGQNLLRAVLRNNRFWRQEFDSISYGPCSGTSGFGGKNWTELGEGRAQELAVIVERTEQN